MPRKGSDSQRIKSAEKGDRKPDGRFRKGHSVVGGRPKAIDLRAAVEEHAAKEGVDLRRAVWEVVQAMILRAKKGDVNAAKLVIERLCAKDDEVSAGNDKPVVVRLVSGVPEPVIVDE